MEKVVEHLCKARFAAFGFRRDAVAVAARGESLAVAGADDATCQGGEVVSGLGAGREDAEIATGDLEGVEEVAGEDGIDLAGGDGREEQGDGELDRFGVFERREVEGGGVGELGGILAVLQQILHGFGAQGADFGRRSGIVAVAEGPVEEAEEGAGDCGRLAAATADPDVTADGNFQFFRVHWPCPFPTIFRIKNPGPQAASICGGRLAALHFFNSTSIIRDWGELLCQLLFVGKWLVGWGLGGFWRVEGLDRKNSCEL